MTQIHPKFNEKLSVLINSQVPEFVQLDHPNFISFLEAYFEFLEQDGQLFEFISQADKYMDIDKTVNSFNIWFKRKFLADIPVNALSSKEFLVKHIREFYRARGTKNSYKFLFRIMFNEEIDFRFPGDEILKSSDGKWTQDNFIKTLFVADTLTLTNREVTGNTSGAKAILENMIQNLEGINNDTLEIKTSHEKGNFTIGETISGTDSSGNAKSFVVDGGIKTVTITNPGSGYSKGNIITITGGGGNATNMEVKVNSIKGGSIDDVTITNPGSGYTKNQFLIFNNTGHLAIDGKSSIVKIDEVDGMVKNISLNNVGDGYLNIPNLVFSGGAGTGASGSANLGSPGIITAVIDTGGTGYTTTAPIVRIEGGGGSGAKATTTISGGVVNSITITERGIGYISNPVIILEGGDFTTLASASVSVRGSKISSITLITEGSGYTSVPTITIDSPPAGGTLATATSTIVGTSGDGRIIKLNIVNPGKNYISLPSISAPISGSNATFTPSSTTIAGIDVLEITKNGFGLTTNPVLDLTSIGDGLATATATIGASLTKGIGRWIGTDSHLSSNRVLEDNDFFQIYSYVIKHSGKTVDFWSQIVKQVLHPAGMKLFGEISISQTLQMPFGSSFFKDKEITLFFPLINFLQVPIATVVIGGFKSDVQIKIISAQQITALGLSNKIFNNLVFFDQGGFSMNQGGISTSLNNIWITNGGSGYTSPVVSISAPGGGGTTATAQVTEISGVINSIFLTNPGSGYDISDFPLTINITGAGANSTAKASLSQNGGTYSLKYLDGIFNQNILKNIEEFPQGRIKTTMESFIEKYK